MDKYEAEKIVNAYGAAIGKGTEQGTAVRLAQNLPCSKAKIKQAFFTYIDTIIKEFHTLETDIGNKLVTTYSLMNSFVKDEEAKELVKLGKKMKKLKNGSKSE